MNYKSGAKWWVKGDLNGFFGLFSNVLTNFLAAIGLLLVIGMPNNMVFSNIVPATAVIVGFGGILLAIQAKRLSIKTGNMEVTAMPYGLSVPHYFAVAFGVIGVVYGATQDWQVALATGLAWNMVQGIIMTVGAVIGPWINKYIPRSAMLGSLAGLAITYIAMNPIGAVFTTPYIGLLSFAIILVGWLALKKMPFNIPAGAFAIIVGTLLAWATGYMNPQSVTDSLSGFGIALPGFFGNLMITGFATIAPFLPAAIPLAIYDFLESLDNLESAAAAGEHYNITRAMLIPGVLTMVGAVLGSPFPTIIYIGHPGWKSTGARIGYSWVTGVAVLVLAFTGLMQFILSLIPLVALLPILVYIGMVITAQAFAVTEKRHMPAVALSFLPLIAGFVVLKINSTINALGAVKDYAALNASGVPLLGWERLAGGDILVGMLICSIAIYVIDRKFMRAAVYSLITGGLAYFGFVHALEIKVGAAPEVALGYGVMALVFILMSFLKDPKEESTTEKA